VEALSSTDMARARTAMAADRTLMAWVRTALSMISFGFTITKFFQYLQESNQITAGVRSARNLGLTLSVLGVAGVVVAVVHYRATLKTLGVQHARARWSVTVIAALAVAIIGAMVLVGGITRFGPF